MKSTKHLKILIFIVIVGGALGGLGNYLMSPAPTENVNGIVKPIILGIISAAVLPVFLKLVSSSVLDFVDESLQLKNYIYFMSFCLLSALFSEVFLKGVYASVFNQFDKEIGEMKAEIDGSNQKADYVIQDLKNNQKQQKSNVTEASKNNQIQEISKKLNLNTEEAKVYYQISENKISEPYELYTLGTKSSIDSVLLTFKEKKLINEFKVDEAIMIAPKQINQFWTQEGH